MSLIVQKRKRRLEIDGGIIGNGDLLDAFRFTRKGFTWQVESSQANNRIVLREKFADYELSLDANERRIKCRRRYPALEALPVQGKVSWVGGDKPIKFRVSPKNVFYGRAYRLITDKMPSIPEDAKQLVPVTVTGNYAALVETGGPNGPRLLDVVLRGGVDVDKAVKAVREGLDSFTKAPAIDDLNSALGERLKGLQLFKKKEAVDAEASA